jgi:hypothetical protein
MTGFSTDCALALRWPELLRHARYGAAFSEGTTGLSFSPGQRMHAMTAKPPR